MTTTVKLLLTRSEAAEALGVGVDRIRTLVSEGEVGFVPIGADERIPADELERWVRANTRHHGCPSGDDPNAAQMHGFSTSGLEANATGSRGKRRTSVPLRAWNEQPEQQSKPEPPNNVARLPSPPPSPATGRSTDDS